MKIITLDFETFFDDEYSLKKMTTEAYVRDPRFEAHGAAVRDENGRLSWERPKELKERLETYDGQEITMLAHHAQFDGLILSHHFDYRPSFWMDTLSMGRICFDGTVSLSLESLAAKFKLEPKNVPYTLFKGKHWDELDRTVQQQVADGAMHDCALTWEICQRMLRGDY